jgi:hypothetical protein
VKDKKRRDLVRIPCFWTAQKKSPEVLAVVAVALRAVGAIGAVGAVGAVGTARVVVAVDALPVVEPELPVTLPTMGLVTVRLASVPTLVKLEPVTVALRLVPVKVPAAAAGMFALTT